MFGLVGDVEVLGDEDGAGAPLAVHIWTWSQRVGVVQGLGAGELGGSGCVRAPGAPHLAQVGDCQVLTGPPGEDRAFTISGEPRAVVSR